MNIAAGIIIILFSGYMPALIPIGIYWPILLAGIPSAFLGLSGKVNIFGYMAGVLSGSIIFIALNFSSWGKLSVMLSFLQLIPTVSAMIVFSLFWAFSPIKPKPNIHTQY